MSATILQFPPRRFSTCLGKPSGAVARSAPNDALVGLDLRLAETEAALSQSSDRLDRLPVFSMAWSWELDEFSRLVLERAGLRDERKRVGGVGGPRKLRLVHG